MDRINVKQLREKMGHTHETFAAQFPVSTRTVSRWEHGDAAPSPMAHAKMKELHRKHVEGAGQSSESGSGSESGSEPSTQPRRRGLINSESC